MHFCCEESALSQYISLKHFDTYYSHNLQLFDILVTIRELIDDRSVCFLYVLVS